MTKMTQTDSNSFQMTQTHFKLLNLISNDWKYIRLQKFLTIWYFFHNQTWILLMLYLELEGISDVSVKKSISAVNYLITW